VNDARRKEIAEAISTIENARAILEVAAQEEREEFDDLPEKVQESDKGTAMDSAASTLEESLDKCDELIRELNDAKV
jgi:hypothetical protein